MNPPSIAADPLARVSFFSGMVCATIYAKILLSPWRPGLKHAMAFATLLLAAYGYLMAHLDDTATTGQIAKSLALAPGTVRNHISAVLSKLGVSTRQQAVLAAKDHRLLGQAAHERSLYQRSMNLRYAPLWTSSSHTELAWYQAMVRSMPSAKVTLGAKPSSRAARSKFMA